MRQFEQVLDLLLQCLMYVMVILLVANQTQYFALPNPEVPTISDPEKVDFGDKTNNFGTELVMEGGGREAVRRAYNELRPSQPAQRFPGCLSDILGVLVRQFVVLQVDILCRALDREEEGHLMCAFPTGYGKSLPMLLLGLLMPEGRTLNLKFVMIWSEG